MAESANGHAARRDLLVNIFAWTANVSTSVVIIFVLKALMSIYRFKYATTVSGLHFVCCAWVVWGLERARVARPADMPLRPSLGFALVGALSVGLANLSLLLNSVGFYQISKLLMSPFVAAVEAVWLGRRFPPPVLMCIAVVLLGVGIVTVSDVTVHPAGVAVAAGFVITGGLQQVLCGQLQTSLGLQAHQLISNTSFLQGMILLIAGPFVDKLASSKWVLEWEVSVPGLQLLGLSCLLAVAVNASQYLVLGRFSATSFQVLGHAKTLLVLIGGWLMFDEPVNPRKLAGMALAVSGMVGYGYFASRPVPVDKATAAAVALQKAGLTRAGAGSGFGTGPAAAGQDIETRMPLLAGADGERAGRAPGRVDAVADVRAEPGRVAGNGAGALGAAGVDVEAGVERKHQHVQ